MDPTGPIGVFDSGLGGLTVVRRLIERMPAEPIIYYADSKYVPYGPRPLEQIRQFATDICDFLVGRGCKMIVMGCNMSSAVALESVRERLAVPVLGTIDPGVEGALETTRNGRIGVAATEGTVISGMYPRALSARRGDIQVFQQACPQFVPIVETGMLDGRVAEHVAEQLAPLREAGVDTLILGCTHYPLLLKEIEGALGPRVTVVDPAVRLAEQAQRVLRETGAAREGSCCGHRTFFSSGDPQAFGRGARAVAGMRVPDVQQVDVHETTDDGDSATGADDR